MSTLATAFDARVREHCRAYCLDPDDLRQYQAAVSAIQINDARAGRRPQLKVYSVPGQDDPRRMGESDEREALRRDYEADLRARRAAYAPQVAHARVKREAGAEIDRLTREAMLRSPGLDYRDAVHLVCNAHPDLARQHFGL